MSAVHRQTESTAAQLLANDPNAAIRRLVVVETDTDVVITGTVPSYYLKQMAQQVIQPAVGRRILRNMVYVDPAGGPAPTVPANPPPPAQPRRRASQPPPEPVSTVDRLVAELLDLEREPAPPDTAAAQRADCQWLQDHWITAELEPYRGETVVVLNGAVVAHGGNPLQLEIDVARRFGVHPYRLVVEYIPRMGERF